MGKRKIGKIADPKFIQKAIEYGLYAALREVEKEKNIRIIGATVSDVDKDCKITVEAYYEELE